MGRIVSKRSKRKIAPPSFRVRVGVLGRGGDASDTPGLTLADLAEIHEYGEFGPPGNKGVRAPIRGWFDESRGEIETIISKAFSRDPATAPEVIALMLQSSIQRRISEGIAPPNSAQTITRKGSSTPLIDTGTLRTAYTAEVLK